MTFVFFFFFTILSPSGVDAFLHWSQIERQLQWHNGTKIHFPDADAAALLEVPADDGQEQEAARVLWVDTKPQKHVGSITRIPYPIP